MASIKMPESVPCQFDKTGWAPCKKPSDNGWCSEHEGLKCASCGAQSVVRCDAQMGGLGCGCPLCSMCCHSMWDDGPMHVTKEAYASQRAEQTAFRQTGQESERMLAKRGVPPGFPKHLKELLAGDHANYELKTCWHLEIKHGLMGYFPAITTEPRLVVFVTEKELIFRVWRSLEPRDSRLNDTEFMVHKTAGIGYPMRPDKEESRPQRIFTREEVEGLFEKDPILSNGPPASLVPKCRNRASTG